MADELIPYSDPATGFTPLGSDLGSINESVIPKSRPLDPSPDHVEALRLNPEFSTDFDSKFGAGASAKYLAQSAGGSAPVAEPEKPGRYRPALTWSTADILAANKPENPIAPMADAFVDSQVRKLQATRDGAALTSVEAFMRGPGPKTKADWLDDEIRSAEWSVGYWQQEMTKTDVGRIAYNADYERAHARLEAARKAKLDLEDKSERTAEPQVQIAIASRIADQKGRVAYAEDQLEAAKDGDLGTGLNVKQYEENLRYERKKLNALETAMDYARQKKAVDAASATGEMGRSFLRSMLAETPEMLAGAVEQISKNFGSEYGQMASEIAGEVKSIAKGLKQDMPAPKQSEILALDPKSTAFANNLKLYAAHAMGQGVGSTTAFWLAAAVGGPATAGGMGITLGVGQMRNALEEEFAKEGLRLQDHDVDAIVYTFGTLIGTLDATGAMFNLNMLGREAKTAAVRHMASAIARGAAKGAIVEGGTEGLQEAIQMLGENYALDRNMDWTKFRDRVIENFAAGSIPGMAFGAKNAHTEQGSARARAEYEKILKEIEAQSTLKPGERPAETQAPTVSSQPETVSTPETEQRGGRPLPPVQAEARDPATIPKPEPVSPQPETLSELSTQEKTDLVEVAKESGIAREGEAPEETLQRMREQRAEGASFGKYDAVFDRLDAVEQELEQQRAKDATIQPDDVEAIVDMWRFVNEAARVKDPEGLIDFLRRSGGIVDFNGDVTSTLGEARMRPGLISNSGLPLDAAARLAWDHGFLTSVERPDINALLDAINEDHAGNRVVRGSDRSTLDDLKIARDMAEELSQFGIRKGMKENEVRDALKGITRESGSGTQDVAANPRGPQPRTIDQVFQGEALASYLERGGQTDVSAWPQIAEALGIELKDVGPALDAAVADGTLRKHDGRYWRNQDVFADDIPFALAGQSKEAAAQAELDKHEQVQALVRLAIGSGQAVNVPKEITGRILDEMRNASEGILDGAPVGAIERIDPIVGEADEVLLTFRALDGLAIQMTMPLSMFLGLRAFYSPIHGGVFSARLFVGQQAPNAIAGEVRHEAVHHGWNTLDVGLRDRLVGHSDTLGVLDMQMGTYLTIVGDPTAAYVQSTTLREAYEERYAGRANFEDVMRQEAVAHLVELASHGYFSEAELAPIAAELAVLRGEAVEMSPAEESAVRQSMRDQAARGATLPDGTKINGVALFAIRAYHGSPHDFDKFDISKIGTGEGAQAYGHGLYFAENEGVAKSYRDSTTQDVRSLISYAGPDRSRNAASMLASDIPESRVLEGLKALDDPNPEASLAAGKRLLDQARNAGKMYEVNITADPEHFLDWDKPLSQQSEKVRKVAVKYQRELAAEVRGMTDGESADFFNELNGSDLVEILQRKAEGVRVIDDDALGSGRAPNHERVSRELRESGIAGIRYLDGGSRANGEGSRNYVVFDDSLIEIVAKDGKPVNREQRTILAALSGSDASRLDMSPEARKARAEQMGFDTSKVWYHGTRASDRFDAFETGRSTQNNLGFLGNVETKRHAVFFSDNTDVSQTYGGKVDPYYLRGDPVDLGTIKDSFVDSLDAFGDRDVWMQAKHGRQPWRFFDGVLGERFAQWANDNGIEAVRFKEAIENASGQEFEGVTVAIFDPSNIRSVNAAFDPAEAGSARLLAALSGGKYERRLEIPYAWSRVTKARAQQLIAELKERIESLESGKERPMGSYSVSDLANHFRENLRGIEAVLPKFDMPTEALRKPFKPSKIVEAGENFVARVATDERHKERAWTGDITYYLHRKPTEAVSKSGRLFGENATAKDLGPELGKVGLYKHDDGRWEVGMVEVKQKYRRMGVASALYDAIEEEMGIKMQPSGILLPDGYRYWSKREPESTRFHQKVNLYGNDLYLSPKRIMKDLAATEQNLSSIRNRLALLEKDGPSPTLSREDWEREVRNRKLDVASYERKRDTYMAALDAVPADGKTQEALDAMFALSGYRQGRNVTEPENLRFWQKPPASGDVLMFHGTRKTFDKFDMSYSRDFGVHFGTAEQASERLVTTDMEGARTIPVEITLKNAIVMPDPGFWGPTEVAGGLMRAGYQVAQAEFDRFQRLAVAIDEAANGNDPKATRSAIIAANQAIAEKLNALGIDGIWYRNRHEGTGWSLTVWNKGQVRSATSNDVLMAMRPSIANRTMPDGQRRVATAGTAEPARSLSQLVADLNQALGLTTRVGRLSPGLKAQASAAGGKLRGQYNTATDVTRLAIPLDIETLSHEGGHALEERFGLPLRVLMEANATEIEKLATPGNDQLSEGFAEFIRRYVTNPNMAEARAPKFFKAFEQFVDKVEPSLLKRLHEVTTGYQDWIDAPSGGAVLSTIKSAKKDGLVAELTKHARKNGFRNVAVDYFHSAYTAIIDGLHPVKMAVDKLIDIANTNLATPLGARSDVGVIAARDPYKLLRLARNAYQGGHVDLMRGVRDYHTHEHKGPSLHDAIGVAMGGFESSHWTDDNIKAFGAYLISRRMVAEWNRFKAGELEGMPDKLSQADHIQAQKDFEQQFPQFIDAAELVYQYQRNLLRKAMEAGFVSEDTYEDLIKRSDYVPAHRDMSEDAEETVAGPGAQTVGANKARLLKQFRGSTRDIINPLETIAKTTYEWNFLIARNDAIKALDRLARAVGPGGGKIAERIPSSQMSGTQVNAIEIVKRAGKQAGMDEADLLFLTNTLEEQLGDDADTVIFRPGEITEGGEPIVYLWEGGKRVAIRLADGKFGKDMYESITGIGRENLGPILELVAKPSQWLRAGVTLDPAFVAANWIRDNPAAWINSADHGTFLPRADRSLRASVDALRAAFGTKVDDLDILSSTGGIVGGAGMEGMSASRIERDIKALQKKGIRIRDALPHKKQFWELTGVTETGTRLSVFRAARERALADGLDEYEATVEAAYTANDLIDFGRHGSKMLAARRLVTFLNAFVQGIDKGIRTGAGGSEVKRAVQDVISPYVRQSDGQVLTVLERKAVPVAAQFYMKMTMIGFVGFALSAVYKDDPEYEEIPEYFRNTHWIFKDATGTWRRVPKPFELGAMSLVMERTFEAYYKGDTKAMKRLVSGLGDLVAPPHVVPGVQVAYELWANKSSFTGGPIVPPNLEKLPGELQFTAYTSELSKWMAVGTGVSAAKIDHAIAGITGSLGRSLLDKSNVIMPPVGMFLQERGMPTLGLPTTPRPEQRDVDRIFVRRFTVDPARSSESKKEFWKEMSTTNGEMAIKAAGYKEFYDRAQFDEAAQTLKRMKEHERVYALVEGHGNATDKREHPMNRAKSVLEVTNGIRRDLDTGKMKDDNGNAYSPSDRRVIQEMFEQIQMREARNSQIVLGLPGFTHLKIMPVEPVIRELEAKVPSIAEELDYRLRKARVKDFDEVRDGYADLKARVLEPDYVEANPPRRKAGRRSP